MIEKLANALTGLIEAARPDPEVAKARIAARLEKKKLRMLRRENRRYAREQKRQAEVDRARLNQE